MPSLPLASEVYPINWYIKHVSFSSKRMTTSRVRYTAAIGYPGIASYLYGTGRTWKDSIKRSYFIVKTTPDVSISHAIFRSNRKYRMRRMNDYTYQFLITNYKPKLNEIFEIYTFNNKMPNWWEPLEGLCFNRFFDDTLTAEQLQYFSLAQLRYLRNAFYARYGRIFSDTDLDTYFRSRGWYVPNPQYSDTLLTDIERTNIDFIVKYENSLKQSFSE